MKAKILSHLLLLLAAGLNTSATSAADALGQQQLPDMGDSSRQVISAHEETELGRAFMQRLQQQGLLVSDPLTEEYIRNLGMRLVSHSQSPQTPFTFFIVNDPSINAFALPGGYIGIHTGLILATHTESELAGVIAHEIAHVTQRHMARTFEEAGRMQIPMAIALLAAILIGSQDGEMGQAAITALSAGSMQQQINFTRTHEQEADAIGIATLADADLDPDGMAGFFSRLQQESRYYSTQAPEFLRTHPINETRIAEARNRAHSLKHKATPDNPSYALSKSALKVLMQEDLQAGLRQYEQRLDSRQYANPEAEYYGYALSLLASARTQEAARQFQRLLDKEPDRMEFIIGMSRAELELGRHKSALQRLRKGLALYPGNHPLTLAYAEALIESDQPAEAQTLLEAHRHQRSDSPLLYQLLAKSAAAADDPIGRHEAQAEYNQLTGDLPGAIQQLEQAQQYPGLDYYHAARIADRLNQLRKAARSLDQQPAN